MSSQGIHLPILPTPEQSPNCKKSGPYNSQQPYISSKGTLSSGCRSPSGCRSQGCRGNVRATRGCQRLTLYRREKGVETPFFRGTTESRGHPRGPALLRQPVSPVSPVFPSPYLPTLTHCTVPDESHRRRTLLLLLEAAFLSPSAHPPDTPARLPGPCKSNRAPALSA